jgi:hypothetical protein
MGYTSNRTILEKADMAIADLKDGGGYLLPAQSQKFMRLLIKQSELMGMATVVPMSAPKQQVAKIKFGSRVLRAGKEATRLADVDRAKPDFSYMELDAKLFKAEIELSDEVLEDSVERGELRQTIMELLAEAIGRDMEEVLIMGDTKSPDPFLAQLDGVLVQTTSHVVDAGGGKLTKDVLFDTIRALPSEYLRLKKTLSFLTSVDTELGYRNTLAERATVGGDKWIETDTPIMYSGIPIRAIPMFPENLPAAVPIPSAIDSGPKPAATGTATSGGAASPAAPSEPPGPTPVPRDRTSLILCNPKNLQVGIWRQIRIETWRDISAGVLRVVATLRFDTRWSDERGTARVSNLRAA